MAQLAGGIQGVPTLKDLSNHVVPEVDTKWYMLGLQLLNTDDVKKLTSIESDYRGSVETCCTKMFGQWLDTVPTANWGQLITALKAPIVKLHKLADNLTKLLGLQTDLNESRHSELSLHLQSYSQPGSPYHSSPCRSSSPYHSSPCRSSSPYHSTPSVSPEPSHIPQVVEPTDLPDEYGAEFGYLVSKISEIIQKSTANNLASIKHALTFVTVHKMSTQPLFSDAEIKQIKQSKDIYELTEQCRKHWSWSKHALLKLIVKKSGSAEAKNELQKFQKVVNVRQRVKNLGSNWLQDPTKYNEGYETLMVVLDEYYDDITVDQLEEAEKFVTKTTLLSSAQALHMVEFTKTNSVLIKWRIPTAVVPFVIMLAFQNKEEFLRRSFLRLTIAGMDVFNLCRPPQPRYQAQVSIEDTNSLRPKNSSLSKDCKEYTDKVISLSQERDDLKAKVTQYEQEIMELQLKCQEKDNEYHLQCEEVFRLGNQVKYLNKKVNALQDYWRQKKPNEKTQQYMTQQSDPTPQQSHHMTQQSRSDEMTGTCGVSLGSSYPPPVNPTIYGSSDAHRQSFTPERTTPLPLPQSSPDLPFTTSTTVKERITTINNTITAAEQSTMHSNGKQAGSHQKFKRSKTPVFEIFEHVEQRDELRAALKKQSSKDMDEYEDYVQQKVSEQRISKPPQKYLTEEATALLRKVQQERHYMSYEESN